MADPGFSSIANGLKEASQKIEASLQETINQHVESPNFSPTQGLDFLKVKNSLMVSYLIELTNNLRRELLSLPPCDSSIHRFTVMKVVLDKSRGLEKKLQYQIGKLLSSGTTATSFAATEDPLHFRPDASSLRSDDEEESGKVAMVNSGSDEEESENESVEADLEAGGATISGSRQKATSQKQGSVDKEQDTEEDGVYRAPRLAAVPYNLDKIDRNEEKEKRLLRRMRASELAQTLRDQYGEGPEQEDIHGGTELGRQREASKHFERMQNEKIRFEEDAMVRLTTTRNEKKERKKLLREESSNLAAIADLGNIVRDASLRGQDGQRSRDPSVEVEPLETGKYRTGMRTPKHKRKTMQTKSPLQAALFGHDGTKTKKSRRQRNSH